MSRVCQLTGKKPLAGNQRTFSNKKTRRVFVPNLQKLKVKVGGRHVTLRVSTKALRTLAKDARGVR